MFSGLPWTLSTAAFLATHWLLDKAQGLTLAQEQLFSCSSILVAKLADVPYTCLVYLVVHQHSIVLLQGQGNPENHLSVS